MWFSLRLWMGYRYSFIKQCFFFMIVQWLQFGTSMFERGTNHKKYVLIDWVRGPDGKIFGSRSGRTDREQRGPCVLTESQMFPVRSYQTQAINILSHDRCVFLTKRTRIDQNAFLAGPYAFSRPYHLTRKPFIRDFFHTVFQTKLRAGPYGSYDNDCYLPPTWLKGKNSKGKIMQQGKSSPF